MTTPSRADDRLLARFWAKVNVTPGCWEWLAATNPKGYGTFRVADQKVGAHRLAYELLVGPVPAGLELHHTCENPSCVRPSHMTPMTHRENVLCGTSPAAQHARKTHCKHGHALDFPNVYVHPNGGRRCRQCMRNRARAAR